MLYLSICCAMFLFATPPQTPIASAEAKAHAGQVVRVCGVLKTIKEPRGNAPTFLNFDQLYPKNEFTAIIWRWQRHLFLDLRARRGQPICVTGVVYLYRERAQMTLTKAEQLTPGN